MEEESTVVRAAEGQREREGEGGKQSVTMRNSGGQKQRGGEKRVEIVG